LSEIIRVIRENFEILRFIVNIIAKKMDLAYNPLLVKKEDLWDNPNTKYEIPVEVQKKFMNGNA
jgi:hypothetical protein